MKLVSDLNKALLQRLQNAGCLSEDQVAEVVSGLIKGQTVPEFIDDKWTITEKMEFEISAFDSENDIDVNINFLEFLKGSLSSESRDFKNNESDELVTSQKPLIERLVNLILLDAMARNASSILFDIDKVDKQFYVWFKINNVDHHVMSPPFRFFGDIVKRFQVLMSDSHVETVDKNLFRKARDSFAKEFMPEKPSFILSGTFLMKHQKYGSCHFSVSHFGKDESRSFVVNLMPFFAIQNLCDSMGSDQFELLRKATFKIASFKEDQLVLGKTVKPGLVLVRGQNNLDLMMGFQSLVIQYSKHEYGNRVFYVGNKAFSLNLSGIVTVKAKPDPAEYCRLLDQIKYFGQGQIVFIDRCNDVSILKKALELVDSGCLVFVTRLSRRNNIEYHGLSEINVSYLQYTTYGRLCSCAKSFDIANKVQSTEFSASQRLFLKSDNVEWKVKNGCVKCRHTGILRKEGFFVFAHSDTGISSCFPDNLKNHLNDGKIDIFEALELL